MLYIIVRIQVGIADHLAGMGRVDELAVAHIDAHMGQAGLVCTLEEHDITGLQLGLLHRRALLVHGGDGAAGLDSIAAKHIAGGIIKACV